MNPPIVLDGATVLQVTDLSNAVQTGKTTHVVKGMEVQGIAFLALARYGRERQIYLFYCDADWRVITDTIHKDTASAVKQAEFEYGPVEWSNA